MESVATATPDVPPVRARRPFSAGDVIGRSFSVWSRSFVPFSIVTLAANIPVFLLVAAAPEGGGRELDRAQMVVSSLVDLIVVGALTHGVLQALNGTPVPLRALFWKGFSSWSRVFRTSLAFGLAVFLGLLLLLVPGLMAAAAMYVAIPASVVEDVGGFAALRRSRFLTKGSRWGVLAVALVAFVVTLAATSAGVVLATVAAPALPHPAGALLATAIAALATPLGACAAAVAYHDLRIAKEGVDTAALVKVFE